MTCAADGQTGHRGRERTTIHGMAWRQVLVNVGRAGAANLDVIQEVEYVKQEAKIVYLLECLQKTAPPVCIFCEKKQVNRARDRETDKEKERVTE